MILRAMVRATELSRLGQRTTLHGWRDPLPGRWTAAKHPNPFMPGWLDAEPVPRRPSAGSVGVTPNDDAHPEHMRSLRKSATSGRLRLFFLGGNLPGAKRRGWGLMVPFGPGHHHPLFFFSPLCWSP